MSGMAEVLAAHRISPDFICECGADFYPDHEAGDVTEEQEAARAADSDSFIKAFEAHQAAALTAAGFGPVKEAAAAGLRSVHDIWGAGGRVTVRMGEIRDADQAILSGEWDNHIKWNMADIAKERARSAAVRGEG